MTRSGYTVVQFERRAGTGHHSLEGLFATVRGALPRHFHVRRSVCRYPSRGVARRLYNMAEARFRRGDVNHVTGDVTFLALSLPARSTILTIPDCEPLTRTTGAKRALLRAFWYVLPMRRAARITTISEATRRELVRLTGADPSRVVVIPACISPAFQSSPREFNDTRPTILVVGTSHNKNLVRLFEALEGIPCLLDIVGELTGEQRDALALRGLAYRISAKVSEPEMVARYTGCDLLAFPSVYEGFGMPIAEAQAVERPVVTSNLSSMPEVAGDGACLVDPYDVADIRRGILRVIGDREYREKLVAAGRENCRRFEAARVAGLYAELYDRVAAG